MIMLDCQVPVSRSVFSSKRAKRSGRADTSDLNLCADVRDMSVNYSISVVGNFVNDFLCVLFSFS